MTDTRGNAAASLGLGGGNKPPEAGPAEGPVDGAVTDGSESNEDRATKPSEEKLSEAEIANLDGAGGSNRVPTYGKHGFQDENHPILDPAVLARNKDGADQQSASAQAFTAIQDELSAAAVGDEPEGDATVQYTSRIAALRIGPFQFQNGVLTVPATGKNEKDRIHAKAFEDLLGQTSPRTRNAVRKIERGEATVARPIQFGSRSTRGVDTSRQAPGTEPRPTV